MCLASLEWKSALKQTVMSWREWFVIDNTTQPCVGSTLWVPFHAVPFDMGKVEQSVTFLWETGNAGLNTLLSGDEVIMNIVPIVMCGCCARVLNLKWISDNRCSRGPSKQRGLLEYRSVTILSAPLTNHGLQLRKVRMTEIPGRLCCCRSKGSRTEPPTSPHFQHQHMVTKQSPGAFPIGCRPRWHHFTFSTPAAHTLECHSLLIGRFDLCRLTLPFWCRYSKKLDSQCLEQSESLQHIGSLCLKPHIVLFDCRPLRGTCICHIWTLPVIVGPTELHFTTGFMPSVGFILTCEYDV